MSKARVAVVVKYFPTVSETFIVNQINSLIDAGYTIDLLAYNKTDITLIHKSLEKHQLLTKVKYFIKPPTSKVKRISTLWNWINSNKRQLRWNLFWKCFNVLKHGKDALTLKLVYEAQWFLVGKQYDIVHCHFGMNGNRIAYLKAKNILPKSAKLINTFHGYDLIPNELNNYIDNYSHLLIKADLFTVNSPYLKSLLATINKNEIPVAILPVSLDTEYFSPEEIRKDHLFFDIVFCGKLIQLKGPDTAIQILRKITEKGHQNVRLHIIGKGPLKDDLEKLTQQYQLKKKVFFHGALSQQSVKEQFAKANLFLLPGRYEEATGRAETQGLVIQEAQAMNLPVVVSDAGGMQYGLKPNETGFVVNHNDVDAYVEVISYLITHPEACEKMGKAGRDFVLNNFSNEIALTKLQKLYKSLMVP